MPDEAYIEVQVGGPRSKRQGVALVDHADAEAIGAYRWSMNPYGYAVRHAPRVGGKQRVVFMHRSLLDLTHGDGHQADHINGDRLDNRRANLRVCTHAENHQNRHGRPYRGAYWETQSSLWKAQVQLAGKRHFLGRFATREEAAAAASAFRRANMPFSADARAETS
jgi:hypothetical protein